MQMHCCDSSSVSEVGHHNNTLRVRYKNGGVYDFHGVSADDFNELKNAKSIGSHLHSMRLTGKKVKE